MHSLTAETLARLTFSSQHLAALKTLGAYQGRQELYSHQTPEVLAALRQVAAIESVESSNRLEGITAPRERIEQLERKSTTPRDRSEQEIAGYRDCLSLIHDDQANIPFSTNVVLQLHQMLCRYMPASGGRWKSTDNEIVEQRSNGTRRLRFRPVPAIRTPTVMESLVQGYHLAAAQHEPLVIIPLTILDFLCIHPFLDGNGRTGRLLTLLLLYHHGHQVGRFISLERIVEESKETYYETLEASSQGWHQGQHDCLPWLTYFWGMLTRAYREFEERVGAATAGSKGNKTDLVRAAMQRHIAPFTISDIEADCPTVSRDMVRVVLRQMKNEGLITLIGKGRGARWQRRGT